MDYGRIFDGLSPVNKAWVILESVHTIKADQEIDALYADRTDRAAQKILGRYPMTKAKEAKAMESFLKNRVEVLTIDFSEDVVEQINDIITNLFEPLRPTKKRKRSL